MHSLKSLITALKIFTARKEENGFYFPSEDFVQGGDGSRWFKKSIFVSMGTDHGSMKAQSIQTSSSVLFSFLLFVSFLYSIIYIVVFSSTF